MKLKKIIISSLLAPLFLITFAPKEVVAQTIPYNSTKSFSEIAPRVDDIDWQYKMIGTILYKRLYNYSTNTPLSDWQIVT